MSRPRTLAPALGLAILWLGPACPQTTQPAPTLQPAETPPPTHDKRVVADTSDYYPAERGGPTPPPLESTPGTGRPDETNGVCRLFAPELQDPECCERALGFDVATVKQACGLQLYLGESFQATCGYYFLPAATAEGVSHTWFRLSTLPGATPRAAATEHDLYTRHISKDPSFTSTPVPGIPGAYWGGQDDLHWAFLPGWSAVRQFTWQDGRCSDEGIVAILKQLVDTPEIPAGTPRTARIPGGPATPATPAPLPPAPAPG